MRSLSFRLILCFAALGWSGRAAALGAAPPGAATTQTLKVPSGPNSVRGLNDGARVNGFSAQVEYSIPIELPAAVNDFRPTLALVYSGDLGNGPMGMGWSLDTPQVRRSLRLGVPSYGADDELELVGVAGGGRLVEIAPGEYRVEGRGHALRVQRVGTDRRPDAAGVGFKLTDGTGTQYFFGTTPTSRQALRSRVQAWKLDAIQDLRKQFAQLSYVVSQGEVYLQELRWGPGAAFVATLGYESRPDPVVSFRRGFKVVTAQRLARIEVRSFGKLLRSYRLGYDDSFPVTRLVSVQLTGSDGVTALPMLTFAYGAPREAVSAPVAMEEAWQLGATVTFLDVDGDGVQDLLQMNGNSHTWQRNRCDGFALPAPHLRAIEGGPFSDLQSARLMDLEGDAQPELVIASGDTWTVYALRDFRWELRGSYPGSLHVPVFASPFVSAAHLDIDGDGRTDVLAAQGTSLVWYRNGKNGLAPVAMPPIAGDRSLDPSGPGVRFFDVNGDGLDDLVRLGNTALDVYVGRGDGTFELPASHAYPWGGMAGDLTDLHLTDLDRDGLMDLVRVASGLVEWYRGRPGGAYLPARTLDRPEQVGADVVVAMVDVNGNGSRDVVWSSPRGMWALDLAGSTSSGMLVGIDNGLGKRTAFEYAASAPLAVADEDAGAPWSHKLPMSLPVPVRSAVVVAHSPTRVSELRVRDGIWDWQERRFAGFRQVTERWPGSGGERLVETTYHVGLGDERVLRGKPLSVRVYKGAKTPANLVTRTDTSYAAWAQPGLVDHVLLRVPVATSQRALHHEGRATPISTLVEYEPDAFGRIVREHQHGRLDLAGDERVIRRAYASDDATWVRDVLIEERTFSGDETELVAHKKLLYGDHTQLLPFGQVGAGWLRTVEELLRYESKERWLKTVQTDYDAWGQPIRDVREGVERHVEYDALHLYPVREWVEAEPGRRLVWQMAWDPTLGLPIEKTTPAGERVQMTYDALGRLTSLGTPGRPAHTLMRYDWSAPLSRTHTYRFDGPLEALVPFTGWDAHGSFRESVSVSNGAGELVLKATHLDVDRWLVAELRERDERGRVTRRAEPFEASSLDGLSAIPAYAPLQRLAYDPLDRPTRQELPTGGLRTLAYEAFEEHETVTDLAPVLRRFDGLGRIVHTERTIGGVREEVDARYDAGDRMLAMSLQAGQVVHQYAYDTLGRLRRGSDPDAGVRTYAYDDGGRVIWKQNGAGDIVSFSYDGAGRTLSSVDAAGKTYAYHYDVPRTSTQAHTFGRLAWVEEPTGTVELSYDELGRQNWMRRTVLGVGAEKSVRYSASGLVLALQTDDGFAVETTYDRAGRPIQVGSLWEALRLDAAGRVLEERFGNGVESRYRRDDAGEIAGLSILSPGGAVLHDVTFARNPMGVLRGVADGDGKGLDHSASFAFDAANRLTEARLGPAATGFVFRYEYDGLQNMSRRLSLGAPSDVRTGSYRYGENGAGPRQLTSILGVDGAVTELAYDGAGRQVEDGERRFGYDGFEQLTRVSIGARRLVEHGYGYEGQRVYTRGADDAVERWFSEDLSERDGRREHLVRAGGRVLARVRTSGAADGASLGLGGGLGLLGLLAMLSRRRRTMALLWTGALIGACAGGADVGLGVASLLNAEVMYFHQGAGAGPVLFTRADGSVAEERRFEPFGAPLEAARPGMPAGKVDFALEPINVLNKQTDVASGLSYHGARWMDPSTARWTQPDPPTQAPDRKFMVAPWKLSPYPYVDQNPISFWDPDGNEPWAQNSSREPIYSMQPDAASPVVSSKGAPAPVSTASSTTPPQGQMTLKSGASAVGTTPTSPPSSVRPEGGMTLSSQGTAVGTTHNECTSDPNFMDRSVDQARTHELMRHIDYARREAYGSGLALDDVLGNALVAGIVSGFTGAINAPYGMMGAGGLRRGVSPSATGQSVLLGTGMGLLMGPISPAKKEAFNGAVRLMLAPVMPQEESYIPPADAGAPGGAPQPQPQEQK